MLQVDLFLCIESRRSRLGIKDSGKENQVTNSSDVFRDRLVIPTRPAHLSTPAIFPPRVLGKYMLNGVRCPQFPDLSSFLLIDRGRHTHFGGQVFLIIPEDISASIGGFVNVLSHQSL